MSGHLRKLIAHLKWADAAALEALRRSSGADTRALTIYSHVLGAEAVWLARLAGRPSDVAVWPILSLEQAASLAERNAAELSGAASKTSSSTLRSTARIIAVRSRCSSEVVAGNLHRRITSPSSAAHLPRARFRQPRSRKSMIRKLKDGRYRLYSRKKDPKTGRRRNLGTFASRGAAEKHERAVQFFKRGG